MIRRILDQWTTRDGWALLVALIGVAAARIGYAPFQVRQAILMLVTGWIVTLVGHVATRRAPWSRIGALLVASALAWYLPAFRWIDSDAVAQLALAAKLVWAAVLGHALLTFPSGRSTERRVAVLLTLLYGVAVVAPDRPWLLAVALVAMLALTRLPAALAGGRRSASDREGVLVLGTGSAFCVALAASRSPLPLLDGLGLDAGAILQLSFMGTAAVLSGLLVSRSARRDDISDLVVDLGSSPTEGLESGLAASLDDPTLRVGIWLPNDRRYVDPRGNTVEPTAVGPGRSVTLIGTELEPIAFLAHHVAIGPDPDLRAAIARTTALASARASLQAALREELEAVRASRRRLMVAADDARDEIERRLDDLVRPALHGLETALEPAAGLDETRRLVVAIQSDLSRIVNGVRPEALEELGLEGALSALAERSGLPVSVTSRVSVTPDAATQRNLMFLVSEALTNVTKHAFATRVRISVAGDATSIQLEIDDDGTGGAVPRAGGGLMGMRDQAETAGGSFDITSHSAAGTRLRVTLPATAIDAGNVHAQGTT